MVDGYQQTYDTGEMSEVFTDIIVKFGVQFVAFATLIALVFVIGMIAVLVKRLRGRG